MDSYWNNVAGFDTCVDNAGELELKIKVPEAGAMCKQ